jgi:transposase
MTPLETRNAVRTLQAQGRTLREISRLLKLSRNTVRRILRHTDAAAQEAGPFDAATRDRLESTFERVGGNAVRIQEILADEHGLMLPYSTLTRWVRQAGLRTPPQRAGEYRFEPAEEMQHDTSPHQVSVGAKTVKAQCASLVLAYSRRIFARYYPRFTRFEGKHFLLEAARFMDGVCPLCIIDNTSVIIARGSGPDAVMAAEMAAFASALGSAPTPSAITIAKGGSSDPSPGSSRTSWPGANSPISMISTTRCCAGAARSPTQNRSACSACRRRPPI